MDGLFLTSRHGRFGHPRNSRYAENQQVTDRYAKWKAKLGRDLLTCIQQKNAATVKACLEQQADPGVMNEVLYACIRSKVDLAAEDVKQRTPLDEALEVGQRSHLPADVIVPLLAAGKEAKEVVFELQRSLPKWRQALSTVLECCTLPVSLVQEDALQVLIESWCFTGDRGGPPSKVQELRRALFTCVAKNNVGGVTCPNTNPECKTRGRKGPSMPKFYCEYCDMFLTHSGLTGRRQHLTGRRHINNKIEFYQMLIREKGLTPPIYPPPPGMVLPMPKLPAAATPKPAATAGLPGIGLPGMLPTMPKLPGVPALPGIGLPGMPGLLPGMPKMPGVAVK
eukprot:symbB.v1.2.028290.t1/scaffold2987.1/size129848/12